MYNEGEGRGRGGRKKRKEKRKEKRGVGSRRKAVLIMSDHNSILTHYTVIFVSEKREG